MVWFYIFDTIWTTNDFNTWMDASIDWRYFLIYYVGYYIKKNGISPLYWRIIVPCTDGNCAVDQWKLSNGKKILAYKGKLPLIQGFFTFSFDREKNISVYGSTYFQGRLKFHALFRSFRILKKFGKMLWQCFWYFDIW